MADNTVRQPTTTGDTLRSDDVPDLSTSTLVDVKHQVAKLAIGDRGVDGGLVTAANPYPVAGGLFAEVSDKLGTVVDLLTLRAQRRARAKGAGAPVPRQIGGALLSPPVIASLNFTLGDTAGGGQGVVITGSNLTGATLVTIGGTSATITGNTPTTVTCTLPAHASGSGLDVVVTTPGGPSTGGTGLFEYWTPAQITGIDAYLDANKGVTGGASVSAWLDQSANARNFTQATGSQQPAQTASVFGTLPSIRFTAASTQFLALGAAIGMATGMSCFAVIKQPSTDTRTAVTTAGDAPYTIVSDSATFAGFGMSNGAIYSTHHTTVPGYAIVIRGSALNDNGAYLVGATYETSSFTNCYLGATQQGGTDTTFNYDTSNQYDGVGGSVNGDCYNDDLGAVVIVAGVISGGDLTKLNQWAQQRFGTP